MSRASELSLCAVSTVTSLQREWCCARSRRCPRASILPQPRPCWHSGGARRRAAAPLWALGGTAALRALLCAAVPHRCFLRAHKAAVQPEGQEVLGLSCGDGGHLVCGAGSCTAGCQLGKRNSSPRAGRWTWKLSLLAVRMHLFSFPPYEIM